MLLQVNYNKKYLKKKYEKHDSNMIIVVASYFRIYFNLCFFLSMI